MQGEALHLLVVAGDDGVDAEGAEARHGEQRLHHDGAADEEADLQAHHGDGRDQGVLQRVLEHDRPLARPLARAVVTYSVRMTSSMLARSSRVRMAARPTPSAMAGIRTCCRLPHRLAPHTMRRAGAGQVHPARAGQQPAEADGEDQQEQHADEELGDGDADHGDRGRAV